jgi:dolichol kinase
MNEIEPRNLGIPLYRRDWSALWYVVASAVCAWLWYRPTQIFSILISCLVGGLAFWFCLGPGLNQLRYHQSRRVRLAAFIASLVVLYAVMQYLVPALSSYANQHAA